MRAFRKHAGWLTALAAGLALLIMSGVLVQMAGRPSLKLDPVQGDAELLKEISLTGVMGDESCSVEFSLENGELQQQFSSKGLDLAQMYRSPSSMAFTTPREGDYWYQPCVAVTPEAGAEVTYEEQVKDGGDATVWFGVQRITRCDSIRIWAGVHRNWDYTAGGSSGEVWKEAMTKTEIVLDMEELSRWYGRELVLVQESGYYSLLIEEDGSYQKPQSAQQGLENMEYQLWDPEENHSVSLTGLAEYLSAASLDGNTYFVPDIAPDWEGEGTIYQVEEFDEWFVSAENPNSARGSVREVASFRMEEGWKVRGLYALEGEQLMLVLSGKDSIRVQLFSAATGEELDRLEVQAPPSISGYWDFAEMKLTSFVQPDGAVLDLRGGNNDWCGGFAARDGKLESLILEEPEYFLPTAAAMVDGAIVSFTEHNYGDLDVPLIAYVLQIQGENASARCQIRTPIYQDRISMEGASPCREMYQIVIKGREQP